MKSLNHSKQAWIWLITPVSLLIVLAAGSGLFFEDIYRASSIFVAGMAQGTDFVSLLIALPILIISTILTRRGSPRARLICLGGLVYVAYTYLMTAFMVDFNALFLVYVALLGLSVYALVLGYPSTDLDKIKGLVHDETPVKILGLFFIAVMVVFYPVWLGEIIPAYIANDLPRMVKWAETPTHAYYVLDLALLFPALGLNGFWLLRKHPRAYTLAGVLLTFLVLETATIVSGMVFSVRGGHPFPIFPEILVYIFGGIITLGLQIWYLNGMHEK